MKKLLCKLAGVMIYFLTPEDSGHPVHHGTLSFGIEADTLNLGSLKAVFWLIVAMVLPCLLTRL